MEDIRRIISNLLGRVFLTKPIIFGLHEHKITLVVSPSMKVFEIASEPKRLLKEFPFDTNQYLNENKLISWANENGYDITFSAKSPELARKLMISFGDVLVESNKKGEKELNVIVLEELEKSDLPQTMKTWAKENPEKFMKNIKYIQELLKK